MKCSICSMWTIIHKYRSIMKRHRTPPFRAELRQSAVLPRPLYSSCSLFCQMMEFWLTQTESAVFHWDNGYDSSSIAHSSIILKLSAWQNDSSDEVNEVDERGWTNGLKIKLLAWKIMLVFFLEITNIEMHVYLIVYTPTILEVCQGPLFDTIVCVCSSLFCKICSMIFCTFFPHAKPIWKQ